MGLSACVNDNNEKWYISEKYIFSKIPDQDYSLNKTYYIRNDMQPLGTIVNDIKTTYIYNKNDRLISYVFDGNTELHISYTEKNGQFIGKSRTNDNKISIEVVYNKRNQLIEQKLYFDNVMESYTRYLYYDNGKLKQLITGYNDSSYNLEKYDKSSNILLSEYYENGDIIFKTIYEYKNNIIIGSKTYDKNGKLDSFEEFTEISNNKVNTIVYSSDNEILGYIKYIYDDNKHLIELSRYSNENQLYHRVENIWSKNN